VKPALSGLADMTSFTEAQMKSVAQYEEDLKKRKQETDNDTRDRTAEKQKFVREKMKKIGKTSHGSLSYSNPNKITQLDHSREVQDTPVSELTEDSTVTENTEYETDDSGTHQPPLLSGVAKVLEKQKKRRFETKRKRIYSNRL